MSPPSLVVCADIQPQTYADVGIEQPLKYNPTGLAKIPLNGISARNAHSLFSYDIYSSWTDGLINTMPYSESCWPNFFEDVTLRLIKLLT